MDDDLKAAVRRTLSKGGRQARDSLSKIDQGSRRVLLSVPLRAADDFVVDGTDVWVMSFWDNTVTHVDAVTGQVIATIELQLPFEVAPGDRAFAPSSLAVGEGGVWVSTARGAVAHIDPSTNEVAATVRLPGDTTGEVVAANGAVWVAENVLGLYKIDPATNQVSDTIVLDNGGQRLSVNQVASSEGAIWVSGTWATPQTDPTGHTDYASTDQPGAYQIDPGTNVASRVSAPLGNGRFVTGDGSLWVISRAGGRRLLRIGANGQVAQTVDLPSTPATIAVGDRAIWIVQRGAQLKEIPQTGR